MIDINQILQWKQEYEEIYQLQIHDQHYIFRSIGREEYKQIILMDLELGEFQESICFHGVIYPEYDFCNGIAGIAEVLSEHIMDASGLHQNQAAVLLEDFREEMMNYDYQVDCMIHEAFPEFSLEEISTWSMRKTMFYLSRTEWVLVNLKGIHPQNVYPMFAEEMEKMQQEQEQQQPQQPQKPAPPQPRQPPQRLVGPPEESQKPEPSKRPAPEGGIQSEEELLALLAGTGKPVSKPITNWEDQPHPELNWFGHMDELQGDFD